MKVHASYQRFTSSWKQRRRLDGVMIVLFLLLGEFCFPAGATQQSNTPSSNDCSVIAPDVDASTDLHAFDRYKDAVSQLVIHEKFQELDCLADAARVSKARFAGGASKLHMFYDGLSNFQLHATELDWTDRIVKLQSWVTLKPESITARVALAEAYTNYAWFARGNGFSDSVTDSGWRLFSERTQKAEQILQEASSLKNKCPEWYAVMLDVALAGSWEPSRASELLQQAVTFEPSYEAYYRKHAVYLLPRWNGGDGDSEKFAQESADHIGGADGDIIYFWIAREMVCACDDDPQFSRMAWPRIQKGYEEVGKRYGQSLANMNNYALMAVTAKDLVLADALFKQIGENWNHDTWKTEQYFHNWRDYAATWAPVEARSRAIRQAAESNLQSPEGMAYLKKFQPKFTNLQKKCKQPAPGEPTKFEFFIQISQDGRALDGWPTIMVPAAGCLMFQLRQSHEKKEILFPRPPAADYWLKLDMDTAMFVAAK